MLLRHVVEGRLNYNIVVATVAVGVGETPSASSFYGTTICSIIIVPPAYTFYIASHDACGLAVCFIAGQEELATLPPSFKQCGWCVSLLRGVIAEDT